MPISTNCLRIAGFIGLAAGVGCSTTSTEPTAALSPTGASPVVASALPESLTMEPVSREVAFVDEKVAGTRVTEVAYAAPASESGSLAAIQNLTNANASAEPAAVAAGSADAGAPVADGTKASVAAMIAKPIPEAPVQLASLSGTSTKPVAARSPELDALIARYAEHYEVPVDLVRRVVKRESTFNPAARNGPYWGLMQIRHDTAKGMGYGGSASGLLDAETNLTYAVKYLRGAYITAGGNHDQAVKFYSRGYYYDAKKRGLLVETGLRPGRTRKPKVTMASAPLPQSKPAEADRAGRVVQHLSASAEAKASAAASMPAPSAARMGGDATPSQ